VCYEASQERRVRISSFLPFRPLFLRLEASSIPLHWKHPPAELSLCFLSACFPSFILFPHHVSTCSCTHSSPSPCCLHVYVASFCLFFCSLCSIYSFPSQTSCIPPCIHSHSHTHTRQQSFLESVVNFRYPIDSPIHYISHTSTGYEPNLSSDFILVRFLPHLSTSDP
jgi:hypothetical protein